MQRFFNNSGGLKHLWRLQNVTVAAGNQVGFHALFANFIPVGDVTAQFLIIFKFLTAQEKYSTFINLGLIVLLQVSVMLRRFLYTLRLAIKG